MVSLGKALMAANKVSSQALLTAVNNNRMTSSPLCVGLWFRCVYLCVCVSCAITYVSVIKVQQDRLQNRVGVGVDQDDVVLQDG